MRDKNNKKVTESSDHYGYEDMNAEMSTSTFRKKKRGVSKVNEDSDYYGYTDSNASSTPGITFRKKKNKKPKIKRKVK